MQENKNSFDDIILDKTNKSEKIKKILLRVIALVILFLVVMIVMKLINSGDTPSKQNIFPAEPDSNNATNSFENIPISQSSEFDEFAALKERMRGGDENTTPAQEIQNANILTEKNQSSFAPPLPEEHNVTNLISPEPKLQEPAPTPPPPAQKPEAKQQAAKPATKPEAKPKPTTPEKLFQGTNLGDKLSAGTYIQIFSVSNFDPKSKELASIEKNGYKYKLYKTKVNDKDITRVLVGPFSKDEINNELKKVQEKIRKEAFIFQVK